MSLFGALNICEDILISKKYSTLHRPLLLRICEEEYKKYNNDRDRLKGVKNTLHTMYGAYLAVGCYQKTHKLLDVLEESKDGILEDEISEMLKDETLKKILSLHASTKERLNNLSAFYRFIFDSIGSVNTVLDIGCGFNPFTLPYFPQKPKIYHALDIDSRIADLNNRYLSFLGMPPLASCIDIALDTPDEEACVAFLFKLLPLVDRQSRGRSAELLREINSRYLIITYPTKSLTGKEKGMQSFYAASFEEVMGGNLSITAKKQIGTELVYVVAKK